MPMVKNGANIRDVAKLAGTSPATVSRVMRDEGYPVTEELRRRVTDAVKELNYEVKTVFEAKETAPFYKEIPNAIGVLLPNTTNPFYQQAMLGIERIAQAKGMHVFVCNTMRSLSREAEYLEAMYRQGIHNIVISPVSDDSTNILKYKEKGIRFVLLEQKIEGIEASRIHFDMRKGAVMAVKHLVENGHKRIALATTALTRWTRIQVYNGYREALEKNGIPFEKGLVFVTEGKETEEAEEGYDFAAGRILGEMLAKRKGDFTAVVCVNDITAAGVMSALKGAKVNVPQDVSLVSFDDVPLASMILPALTTVRFSTYDAGMLATNLLMDQMDGITRFPVTMKLEPTLIARDTVRSIEN